ncbi:MAG: hypothetical protein DCC59_04090 [Chloroflexi bacterium]|nr:hypothetical protein [Chloroflexi bacterium CFX1]MCK6567822.1 glycosyltransferase family 39 protein [Anaerolineales bacterium]MCQ3954013.1 hypothetical protein [Chloroflexota bacterium]MDL1918455.1 hypothetical protein [Chloroflexi bacterium CFX5]NUQ59503.1 glycosyltransferase family 39 protein [Anaerolineales bacterium]
MTTKFRAALPYIFLVLLTLVALDLANPVFNKPSRDGGFFLYAGAQILKGKTPYTEIWDNKGPGIFYVNALGLWLGGGSRWGVWLVEFLCIFGAFVILYRDLSRRWGNDSALFGLMLAGMGLQIALGYGNYSEEYPLLLNAAGLSLFFSMQDVRGNYWKYFGIGAWFGLSFSFRANNIGGFFAILGAVFLFLTFKKEFWEALKIALAALAGFATPNLLWILYFALLGAATDMIYGSLTFNFSYSAAKDREWVALFGGFGKYGMGWVGWFTLAAWFALLFRALKSFAYRQLAPFELFLVLWFPAEILLSNLSGRNFTHYYISWTLAVAVYCAFVYSEAWLLIFKESPAQRPSSLFVSILSVAFAVALFLIYPSFAGRYADTLARRGEEFIDPISAYIIANTQPEEFVLTWYPERGINFASNRASPVKYTNYPLFLDDSLTAEIENAYIENMMATPPSLIVDCARSVDAIPSLDPVTRQEQYATPGVKRKMLIHPGMDRIFNFVTENYHIETTVEGCLIFRLNP